MIEKRYSLVYYADKGGAFIKDNENGTEWYHDSRASLLGIVDKLNELNDENMKLKGENAHYKLLLISLKKTAEKFCEISKVKE